MSMDIIKNLKDYKFSVKQRIFAGFLSDKIASYTCSERITNKRLMRQYFAPDNEYTVYATAVADATCLKNIKKPFYDDEELQAG